VSSPLLATPARVAPPAATTSARAGVSRAATAPRFAIEFGPFVTASDAERVERRLTEAGYSTVRTRQLSGAAVYAVLIERLPTTQEAKIIAVALREHGVHEAVIVSTDPVILRVGALLPLRGAVELAKRVRAAGHQVRLAAQPGEASALIVRHGAFTSRTAAEARRRELGQLDLPAHQIVQVR
jgi:cell division septation protein DedD